ncbi:hypothetical protein PMG11_01362 [Penicillium brasilianum]|uniref:Uncharacterized protein n=1 Tax=Penicillium brasilianum TaxID=104259 RepID=A0A0F7TF20_PENBI|nr:hypothetical protein PMG11_01362 [Penicillium brasilianum]
MQARRGWLLPVGRALLILLFLTQYAFAGDISRSSIQPSSTPNASSRTRFSSSTSRRTSSTSTPSTSGIISTPLVLSRSSSLGLSSKTSRTTTVNQASSILVPSSLSVASPSSHIVAPSSSTLPLPGSTSTASGTSRSKIQSTDSSVASSTKPSVAAGGATSSNDVPTAASSSTRIGGSASTPLVSVTPVIITSTIVQNGVTKTVPVIVGGSETPITLPPVTTTVTGALATSSVSSVSSEIMALIPILNSWKSEPDSLKESTLKSVENVKSDVENIISNLGGSTSSSSPCSSKKRRKRGLFDFISNAISALACIGEDLTHVTDDINLNDIEGVEGLINSLTTSTDELNDEDDSESSKTDSTSSTSTSSTCTASTTTTALRVTVLCETTSITADGSTSTTETCSPSTVTITTTGCAVTGLTTTISTATTTSSQVPCASDTCGDSCPMSKGVLSGTISASSTNYCASLATSYTSALPTASYGVVDTDVFATDTPTSASSKKRSARPRGHGLPAKAVGKRALPSVAPPYSSYVSALKPSWVSQNGDASGQWFGFPIYGHVAAGVNGIYGCTSVIIVSEKGVYVSHIWEVPVFIDTDYKDTDDSSFKAIAFEQLRDGTSTAQSITALVGTDENPGVLHAIYAPKVFVLTPKTSDWDRDVLKVTTTLRYDSRARQLGQWIASVVPGSGGSAMTLGYQRTSRQDSTAEGGTAGRAILEVDPFQYWLTTPDVVDSPGLQVGQWRLWVEDQLITTQDFWTPRTIPLTKREIGYANPCGSSSSASPSSSTPVSSSTKIKSCAIRSRTATVDITSVTPSSSVRASTPSTTSSTKSSTTKSSTTLTSTTISAKPSGSATSVISTTHSTTPSGSTFSLSSFTTRASSTVTTSAIRYCLNYADHTTDYCTCSSTSSGSVLYTSLPLMTDGYCKYTTFPAPTTTTHSTSTPTTITAAPTATTTYCLNYANPHSNVDYCTCSSTSGKSVYYTSLPLMSDGYCSYTTFPSSTNPYPYTKTAEGSVIAYATSTVSILHVAGYTLTETYGSGSSTVLETPAPTGFPYTTTSDDTVIAYATSTISYMDVAGYKLTLTYGAGSSTVVSTPAPTASCAMWSEIAAYMFLIYDIDHWDVDEDDLQSKLKSEESGCGAITAWDFNTAVNGSAGAKFNLPTLMKSGCVERAVKSAGGPSISCSGHGTHVFDGGDSVQQIYDAL